MKHDYKVGQVWRQSGGPRRIVAISGGTICTDYLAGGGLSLWKLTVDLGTMVEDEHGNPVPVQHDYDERVYPLGFKTTTGKDLCYIDFQNGNKAYSPQQMLMDPDGRTCVGFKVEDCDTIWDRPVIWTDPAGGYCGLGNEDRRPVPTSHAVFQRLPEKKIPVCIRCGKDVYPDSGRECPKCAARGLLE